MRSLTAGLCLLLAAACAADGGGGGGGEIQVKPVEEPEKGKGTVTVTGRLTDEGVECQALRGDDGQLYTLSGDLKGFKSGDRVRVTGRVAEMSFCMQGTTLAMTRIEAAPAAD